MKCSAVAKLGPSKRLQQGGNRDMMHACATFLHESSKLAAQLTAFTLRLCQQPAQLLSSCLFDRWRLFGTPSQ